VIKSGRLRWTEHVARIEYSESAFKILTDNPTGNRSLGRRRHIWVNNIRMDLKRIGLNTRNWIDAFQDRDYWKLLCMMY
jgi:hypothetical protein